VSNLEEIVKSKQAPAFIHSTKGNGELKEIKNDRLREKVREQIFKRRNQDVRLNPNFSL
jgi:hypothetical protein